MALAKALTKVAKDVPAFKFKAGVVEGRVLSIAEIQQLAQLPSKEELISKMHVPAECADAAASPRRCGHPKSGRHRREAVKAEKFGPAAAAGAGRNRSIE